MTIGHGFRSSDGGAASPPYTKGPYTFSEKMTYQNTLAVVGALSLTKGVQSAVVSRIGATAGISLTAESVIADGTSFVTVTVSDINKVISLPTATPGNVVRLIEPLGTGYELRSDEPEVVAINGGTGSSAESAIGGSVQYVQCVCTGSTAWVCTAFSAGGSADTIAAAS